MYSKFTRLVQLLLVFMLLITSVTPALASSLKPQNEVDSARLAPASDQSLFERVQALSDDDDDDRDEDRDDDDRDDERDDRDDDDDDDDDDKDKNRPKDDIVDVAVNAGAFNTLVAAVQAAGLEDTLRSKGPFTVFAPTDEAFEKLGLNPTNISDVPQDVLSNILLYHVVGDKRLKAKKVVKRNRLIMAQGQKTQISVTDGGVFINESQIIVTDVMASNGVIHVIDTVLIPPTQTDHDDDDD